MEKVSFREDEVGNKYPFIDFGSETHGKKSFRLWISGRLLEKDEEGNYIITFPKRKAKIEETSKGSLVLRSAEDTMVYDVYVRCGYRGSSDLEILTEHGDIFQYWEYRSPRGNLGISKGVLVNAPDGQSLKYKWKRTGRLYGNSPEGITIIMPDGKTKEFEDIPDGLAALQELLTLVGRGVDETRSKGEPCLQELQTLVRR